MSERRFNSIDPSSAFLISYKFSYVLIVLDHEIVEEVTGYTYGPLSNDDPGCFNRLKIGSKFAQKIRDEVFNELGITMSCGISWKNPFRLVISRTRNLVVVS